MSNTILHHSPLSSAEGVKNAIVQKLIFSIGRDPGVASQRDWLNATLLAVRDLVSEGWLKTQRATQSQNCRRVYYLSMEFLMGRTLSNAMLAEGVYDVVREALEQLGLNLEDVIEKEVDPGLGNGGLGRLAACFLDSIATLNYPGMGYGIRYEYGMFRQKIVDGQQVERPDAWLEKGVPWEFIRPTKRYKVEFGGRIYFEGDKCHWVDTSQIVALGYDQIIPGYETNMANSLRLWSAHAGDVFDLTKFNRGDYFAAMERQNSSENVSRVLYPDDSTYAGRELRLRQEYFLVSASLQDILNRHRWEHKTLTNLADKVAIHLNDTHPVLAIPELMRILIDKEEFSWKSAWEITCKVFSYTNHTLMSEALETWPVDMMGAILPRHLQIILEINEHFLESIKSYTEKDPDLIRRVSLIDENDGRKVRMAWLAVVASHKINGVAKLHSDLMVKSIFADFAKIYPERFCNMTNGITPRRWIGVANPGLSAVIDKYIGKSWRKDLSDLEQLKQYADFPKFMQEVREVKKANKVKLANYIAHNLNIVVNPDALFDVQIKRIHEYKRQHLNLLHIIARYNEILRNPEKDWTPRVFIIAGKAASAYYAAKQIIRLINDVAKVINNDMRVHDKLKLVFIPNYSVSLAQLIIPAADVSEQISLAGTEASGTSNMKFALNGALTVGTLDGANVEILQNVGEGNIFIFGNTVEQVEALRHKGYQPSAYYENDPQLREALQQITSGAFSPEEPGRYQSFSPLSDYYQAFADFRSYVEAQREIDKVYKDQNLWVAKAIQNIVNMSYFSSDRTIKEYADQIWHLQPVKL
ncbi:glycogen/starch/alpha-glucan family phosphorylase [Testudinibacter sp. TR-2022]|uniref:glycogen/starch/alpha-glucan family phosphorylase n=1 Tax=Testudinibacter sp. TR-2022 TaxID=2585029 RepID=UPI00111B15F5|nr:glycogen/starch/alpha-glucan family phosphorylase [Testudinibacter sp. TR-2022]TNH03748.1 glycogen/starch/alpha-glucan family phosphorylase [Pasteurellaceae bacterium Phil31]TNH11691.1 glycogen/starch/alpha-glucan family phosphorylase [Testudinibacter sp. TR-2022]TNH12061.1 glycogen/starch/alpha-glucan family phosphorylase [Testudinibacter sp. TR-2022]TNH15518.1 glycogen/starch/alpha-glucan family phosphorylase [Testudinibacter sp. TR-2022]TNH15648.1 glycogen/starch/alpha-glucan family phos